MSVLTPELIATVRGLPPPDRLHLVDLIMDEIDDPASVEEAWRSEAATRLAAYERGELASEPAADVLARLRAI